MTESATDKPTATPAKPLPDKPSPTGNAMMTPTYMAKLGLPAIKSSRLKFNEAIEWWRSLNAKQRARISVYVYRLFPVISKGEDHSHNIALLGGETPLGGETGPAEEDVLGRWGLGDYLFIMNVAIEQGTKPVCRWWLLGYRDGLPGFTSFKDHPPLISDVSEVVLDNERNIRSGFITWLKAKGELPGLVVKENIDVAEQTATNTAVGVLGDIAKRAFEKSDTPAPSAESHAPQPQWDAIDRTIETVGRIHEKNAVNPTEFLEAAAKILKTEPPAPPPPVDLKPLTDQVTHLTDTVIQLQTARADDLREEIRDMRKENAARETRTQVPVAVSPPAPPDPLLDIAKRMLEKKLESFINGDDEAVVSPRRRRHEDEEEAEPVKPWYATALENAPAIFAGLTGLTGAISLAIHNARVMQTGEGTTIAPVMPDQSMNPALMHQQSLQPVPPSAYPQPQPPNPQPQQPMSQQEQIIQFLRQIELSFTGAMERNETGFEYAETFIKAWGRSGALGYAALKGLGDQATPFPQRAISTFMMVLQMYPPIWAKVGADSRLPMFLEQFLTYDELLKDYGVTNLTTLVASYEECETVQDVLDLPDEDEGGEDDDGGDGETRDARPNGGAIPMPPVGGAVTPEVVTPPPAMGTKGRTAKPKG